MFFNVENSAQREKWDTHLLFGLNSLKSKSSNETINVVLQIYYSYEFALVK